MAHLEHRIWLDKTGHERPVGLWYAPAAIPPLEEDADDVLLALLGKDFDDEAWRWSEYRGPYRLRPEPLAERIARRQRQQQRDLAWEQSEARLNRIPWKQPLTRIHIAERLKELATRSQRAAAQQRKRVEREAAERLQRHLEITGQSAAVQAALLAERQAWIECLRDAIAACEDTRYAALIPQMQYDIANIESQPPGALPWRFDRAAFRQHFASFKAQIDAGAYRRV